jgi:UDP-N-acetyl-D-mannosaminuronic acid dehydrogenase
MSIGKVCVVGLGYIGLPTAVMFAQAGLDVVGTDVNRQLIDNLRNGKHQIWEPGLGELLAQAMTSGKLRVEHAPESAEAFLLCVPTPVAPGLKADLSYVEAATRSVVPYLRAENLIVLESTVPPGATDVVVANIVREAGWDPNVNLHLAHCPERVLPGNIVHELVYNSRCVGGMTEAAAILAKELYASFVKGPLIVTDSRTAEISKLMENTYRDVNIALANEFARICAKTGINVWEAIRLANEHPRVNILRPGPGVGGHCIAVDPYFIIEQCPEEARIISLAREINSSMPEYVLDLVSAQLGASPAGKVSVLGLAYKANSDDLRESPAIEITKALIERGYRVQAFEPMVRPQHSWQVNSLEECVTESSILVVLTDHEQFKTITPAMVKPLMRDLAVVDTRALWDRSEWVAAGFDFVTLGDGKHARLPVSTAAD